MNMTIRPMTPAERNYAYTQSQQLICQTSCIGHLILTLIKKLL